MCLALINNSRILVIGVKFILFHSRVRGIVDRVYRCLRSRKRNSKFYLSSFASNFEHNIF